MIKVDKIDRPPAAENWTRMQSPDVDRTAKNIFNFFRGQPLWGYQTGRKVAQCHIEDGIDRATGLKMVERFGSSLGRPFNRELVLAFFDYVEENPFDGVKAFDGVVEYFPLRRSSFIPIKPLTVIRQDGHFTPVFLCPWSNVNFDSFQRSLLMTVLERSLFTLTDFEDSPGKILFFPKRKQKGEPEVRKPMIWSRGQFPLLSDKDLSEQVKIFFEGKEKARLLYQEHLKRKAEKED